MSGIAGTDFETVAAGGVMRRRDQQQHTNINFEWHDDRSA
jgi:hypothetical protein